ncbi:hypothetical protein [Acinetobacter guerrae]|nr:hypothetical protein [Acinetobacter guerrae]
MIYKILMGICLLSLGACDTKYLGDSIHAKSVEQSKLDKTQSNLFNVKSSQNSKDIKRTLDNKIYVLLNSKEGCVVSENPLNNDIVVIYKEDEKFKYDIVKPISKKDDTDCVSNLTFVTDEPNYFYNIDKKTKTFIRGYGFELSKNQIMYSNGTIRGVDLIGNGIPNIITECFSSEGSHFNIWGGENNEEKLLHRYTFLDMNMQSSCTESDKIFSPGLLDLKK